MLPLAKMSGRTNFLQLTQHTIQSTSEKDAQCPLRVKTGSGPALAACPFCPQEQTSPDRLGISEKCQYATSAKRLRSRMLAEENLSI
jgi:hypothetical protein